ncbi:hypothetical protein ACFSHR_00305, partial [Azotobacter chroococcum]
ACCRPLSEEIYIRSKVNYRINSIDELPVASFSTLLLSGAGRGRFRKSHVKPLAGGLARKRSFSRGLQRKQPAPVLALLE